MLIREGYNVKGNGIQTFNIYNAIKDLEANNIIFMVGHDTQRKSGHGWIVDAYSYCIDPYTKDITYAAVHCNWGWGGTNNGYFSGEVFSVAGRNYDVLSSFSIGIH